PSEGARLAAQGEALFFGRGGCHACHSVGKRGTMLTGPNLGVSEDFPRPFARRAAERRPGLTPLAYALESVVDPDAFVVPTYAPGVMKRPEEPPIALNDDELLAVAAYVASIGAAAPAAPDELATARASIAKLRAARATRLAHKP
ncbi:MAG: c-type cytochrome, partial [Deltaproteobacteria bacterium]